MNKVKTIKVKNEDGSVSEESYAIAADALNIDMVNGKNVQETIGTIDVDKDGNIAAQLNKKINKSDIIDNLDSSDNNKVLSAKQGKVLNEAVAAANSDIKKKIYYFNTIAEMKADEDLVAGDTCQLLTNNGVTELYKIINDDFSEYADDYNYVKIVENELYAVRIEQKRDKEKLFGMKINSTRIFRKLCQKGQFILNPSGIYYSNAQGFCMINDNTAVMALVNYPTTDSNTKIIEINLTTGAVVNEITGEYGHCNGITYNPDDKLIYVVGIDSIIVIDYDTFTVNDIVSLETPISGISYDKITKRLYYSINNNETATIYEISKTDFTIINTINLELVPLNSQAQQNIKVHNGKIYRILGLPNILNIYDIQGNFINSFIFNEFMDNAFYIGELQDIDFIDDYLYFNSCILSLNRCPLSIVNIGKTSLNYNIINSTIYQDALPNGTKTITINNSIDVPNPDGTTTKPFKELVEAICFLTSPIGQKYNANINIVATGIEYAGCQINGNNILRINGNGQTIGHLIIKNMSGLEINGLIYKGTVANEPNLYIQCCGNVDLYRPNFINNSTGSNYAINIDNADVNISGYNANDIFDGLNIYIVGSSQLINKNRVLTNIIKDNVAVIKEMTLFKGTINANGQTVNYSSSLTGSTILQEILKYKYIVFEMNLGIRTKIIKFDVNTDHKYRFLETRSNNSPTTAWLRHFMYALKFTSSNILVEFGKQITQDLDAGTTTVESSNIEGYISKIYLTDF